jgi:hypothetical protein
MVSKSLVVLEHWYFSRASPDSPTVVSELCLCWWEVEGDLGIGSTIACGELTLGGECRVSSVDSIGLWCFSRASPDSKKKL